MGKVDYRSPSGLKTYQRCPKLWWYTYTKKLMPIDSGSFEASYGSAFHALREGDTDRLEFLFGDKWQGVIRAHSESYDHYWSAHMPLNVVEQELKFRMTLADGYNFGGIVDGVVLVASEGEYYLLETKTTGASDLVEFCEKKAHDRQMLMYLLAAREAPELKKYNIKGIIVDATRRPSIRQRKNKESDSDYVERVRDWYFENREKAFHRHIITKTNEELDDFVGELMMLIDLINTGMYPKNPDSCFDFRKKCGFYGACHEGEPLTSESYTERKKK